MPMLEESFLREVLQAAFGAQGLSPEHVAYVVDGLIEPSLRGIDTHGVRLARTYLDELRCGRARAQPRMREQCTLPAAVTLDANDALGIVAGNVAAGIAVRQARQCGIAGVAVTNSNHFGAAAVYSLKIAAAGMLGLCFSNADALVAPFNGRTRMLGTNPMCFAAPGLNGDAYCLDMATSQIAYSKVKQTLKEGRPLPSGWCVEGGDGVVLQPFGGYKGQGLALMVQILSALLTGMTLDHQMDHLYESDSPKPRKVGHFFVAINIGAFVEPAEFEMRLQQLLMDIRRAAHVPGAEIRIAGDRARESRRMRVSQGIPLTVDEQEYFLTLAAQFGVETPCLANGQSAFSVENLV